MKILKPHLNMLGRQHVFCNFTILFSKVLLLNSMCILDVGINIWYIYCKKTPQEFEKCVCGGGPKTAVSTPLL